MDSIYKRRSIRRYTSRQVDIKDIEQIIKAGMNAPSAGNQQPWHFIVINDRVKLDAIMNIHPHSKMLKEAGVAILVCGDLSLQPHEGYWVQDCSAATENMLLEITEKGLGGVWLGVYPREDRVKGLQSLLRLPENVVPFALVPVGYPAENKEKKNIFRPERIHINEW